MLETKPLRALLDGAQAPERRVLRFYGASESAVAQALAAAGGDGGGVEATICARDFEIHVDLVVGREGTQRADELVAAFRERLGRYVFAEDERPVGQVVLDLCRQRLHNAPARELKMAAEEQMKITRLRLEKWLHSL